MPATVTVLRAVRESGSTWRGFMSALPDRPCKGERSAMRELQNSIGALESLELIKITRDRYNEVAFIGLTELGQERLSEAEEEETAPKGRERF
jgi:hypothetical protein